ncbi:hypothetical protein [Alkalihalobacterium chitinilyticum]|uniref:HAMP domain-containing protein n=1 Tax=Alkalihalobacterium chitinilyticum TaxID=2980103 RepID=A0ABT5VJ51_9BACI|nr:hypothetical protein [Alkalihalobacterium chitinilyticum]MDE5415475.1 hypothetical protein [Alkalihalobacterium chitinilyticum]
MLRKKLYGIICIGMLMTMVTTYLSIMSLIKSDTTVGIIVVLTINLGVYAALLVGLLEYLVLHRIKSIVKDLQDVEDRQHPKCRLIDLGDNDEISYITRKLNQSIEGLNYKNEVTDDFVIQYKPTIAPKTKAI